MKRILLILLSVTTVWLCTACQNDDRTDPSSGNSSSTTESSDISDEPVPARSLLDDSFGTLYGGTAYYLETDMTVESTSSPDTSNCYHLTVAIDKTANQAMLLMSVENGTQNHIIIRDRQSYNLNDTDKTYTVQSFEDSIELFAKLYTSDLYLGITEPLTMMDTGNKKITVDGKEQEVTYEEYRMAPSDSSAGVTDEAYITYYFDKGQPCMEIMETAGGKTTFVFRKVTDQFPDKTLFDIPNGYERV